MFCVVLEVVPFMRNSGFIHIIHKDTFSLVITYCHQIKEKFGLKNFAMLIMRYLYRGKFIAVIYEFTVLFVGENCKTALKEF